MKMLNRPRRLRSNKIIRDLSAEIRLDPRKMIQPYFISERGTKRTEISSMPGIYRDPADKFVEAFQADFDLGINKIMLFGVVTSKDGRASLADDKDNPVNSVTRQLKEKFGDDIFVAVDVCLCEYTDSGHCGLIKNNQIDNDSTLERLADMALAAVKSGADCLGPSDMMDGRIGHIRARLEEHGYQDRIIMAYTAKYASSYYGPFRDAAESAPKFGDRKSYQMDFRNRREALRELEFDLAEGADIVMVKPALAYLDIISMFRENSDVPVAAYNVSGEYTMAKLMAKEGMAIERDLVTENLSGIFRAGADMILTYHLRDILQNGWHNG
ncbi:Delta-aminolevulinic acid dehydratase [Candidatus Zixiibacteriota bacterium]|nr:Delta-aminolevulinic acid dehydratase [candidate division Zixibacteria bacterium]